MEAFKPQTYHLKISENLWQLTVVQPGSGNN